MLGGRLLLPPVFGVSPTKSASPPLLRQPLNVNDARRRVKVTIFKRRVVIDGSVCGICPTGPENEGSHEIPELLQSPWRFCLVAPLSRRFLGPVALRPCLSAGLPLSGAEYCPDAPHRTMELTREKAVILQNCVLRHVACRQSRFFAPTATRLIKQSNLRANP